MSDDPAAGGRAPTIAMRSLIADGKLVEALPRFRPAPVSILYAHRRNLSKRVRVFMDWIAEALAPYLDESTETVHAL